MIKHNNFKSTQQKSRSESAFLINTNAKSINVAPFEISNSKQDPEYHHQVLEKNSVHTNNTAMNVLKNINNIKRCKQETENTFQSMINKIIANERIMSKQSQTIEEQKRKIQEQQQNIHELKMLLRKQQEEKQKLKRMLGKMDLQERQKEKQITQLYKEKAQSERKHRTHQINLQVQLLQYKLNSQSIVQKQFDNRIQKLQQISMAKDQSTTIFQN